LQHISVEAKIPDLPKDEQKRQQQQQQQQQQQRQQLVHEKKA